jgi:membrane protease YdiL (CAAX protease family)
MHQRLLNALASTIIVAVLSGLWHLPLFFTANYPMVVVPYIVWLLERSAAAVLITWLYNSTKGSVLITTIFHAARNMAGVLVFLAVGGLPLRGFYLEFAVIAIAAILIIWRAGAGNLRSTDGENETV